MKLLPSPKRAECAKAEGAKAQPGRSRAEGLGVGSHAQAKRLV